MTTYSKEFKAEAIRLSDEIGNKKAAEQLGKRYGLFKGSIDVCMEKVIIVNDLKE